ncbi:hypothetical protein [Flavobacterium arundinis]|uniref:hypothetical protein n=1 Tax=Flavobacterium arundinis TaxID=3139143 RepID=UPI00311ED2AF
MHLHPTGRGHTGCIEKVVIFLEGHKKSPLQLSFRENDNGNLNQNIGTDRWCIGYPDEGVIWLFKYKPPLINNEPYPIDERQTVGINLNRPAVIAALIRYFLQNDWKPKESVTPYIVDDALKLPDIIDLPKGI